MTLSLSLSVRQFICQYLFFPFVCLETSIYMWNAIVLQASRKFKGCLKNFLRVFQWYFNEFKCFFKNVLKVFQGSIKGLSRRFYGYFNEVARVFQ